MITIWLFHVLDVELDIQYIPLGQNIRPLCLILVREATTRRAFLIVPFVINEIHFIGIKDIVKLDVLREYIFLRVILSHL